jgi:hypothetical protein
MKKLKGSLIKHASLKETKAEERTGFEVDEIRIELDHDRVFTIRRDLVRGSDGIYVGFWSERVGRTDGVRIVVRPVNFAAVQLTAETNQ